MNEFSHALARFRSYSRLLALTLLLCRIRLVSPFPWFSLAFACSRTRCWVVSLNCFLAVSSLLSLALSCSLFISDGSVRRSQEAAIPGMSRGGSDNVYKHKTLANTSTPSAVPVAFYFVDKNHHRVDPCLPNAWSRPDVTTLAQFDASLDRLVTLPGGGGGERERERARESMSGCV